VTSTTTVKPCPVCGGRGRQAVPDLAQLDATCSACGWHYTTRREGLEATTTPPSGDGPPDPQQQALELARELGADAAGRASAEAAARGERPAMYPPISTWLGLADSLKARGWGHWLDRELHSAFMRAYRDGLEARAPTDDARPKGGG
jgi:hypothetical protein